MKPAGKNLSRLTAAFIFCSAAASLWGGEAEERKLGDNAFFAGDYRNAAQFYNSAMVLSDAAGNADAWAENALKSGYARFYDGDIEGAQKILAEFRRRHPVRSAGTLPGDLLAASGKSEEAEKFYQTLIAAGSPEMAAEAAISRGYLRLRLGDFEGAVKSFKSVADSRSPWSQNARWAVIYTRIRQNNISAALKELGEIPPGDQGNQWQLLRWYADLHVGKVRDVSAPLMKYLSQQPARHQPTLCEVAVKAAEENAKSGDWDNAAAFYEKAQLYCPDNVTRQEILRRLFNLYAKNNPTRVRETAEEYAKNFPAALDRAELLLGAGRLLLQSGRNQEAVPYLLQIAQDPALPPAVVLSAAEMGAVAAEKGGRRKDAEFFYQLLISKSADRETRFQWTCRHIQYLLNVNEVVPALQIAEKALSTAEKDEKEALLMLQLQALRRSGNAAAIRNIARLLLSSKIPQYAATSRFILAETFENSGDFAEARRIYLEAAALGGEPERASRFRAALMAYQNEETESAVREFSDFAARYPKAENAPVAFYYAICASRESGAPEPAEALQLKLKELYPASPARIAAEMLSSERRAENGDPAGAAADLARMIGELTGRCDLSEAMLMRVRFLQLAGEREQTVSAAEELNLAYPGSAAAAEALLLAGNQEFNRGDYNKARQFYLRAESSGGGDVLLKEIISGRIIDAELILGNRADALYYAGVMERCRNLFTTSRTPLIRLQSRCKFGFAKERCGDVDGAISAFEQLLYDAEELKRQGIPVPAEWCVRAANEALRLIADRRQPDALLRGNRLIDHYEALMLSGAGENFSQLRREFRKKITQPTPRR